MNVLQIIKIRKENWIGHTLYRSCLLKYVNRGEMEGRGEKTGRRGRRSKKLLDDLEEKRGYCKIKEEAVDDTLWRTGFGGGYEPVGRQTGEL
jgi:hypothetical protein